MIDVSEEQALWDKGVMGHHAHSALLNAVFFIAAFIFVYVGVLNTDL